MSDERCFRRSLLEVLGGRHAVGEGDRERVERGLPPHGPSCLVGALGVHPPGDQVQPLQGLSDFPRGGAVVMLRLVVLG